MLVRGLKLVRLTLLVAGALCILGRGGIAFAQEGEAAAWPPPPNTYVGAGNCAGCHKDEYNDWAQHGHAWMYVPTGGQVPPSDLFYPLTEGVGEDEVPLEIELPVIPTGKDPNGNVVPLFTWENVRYIVGHFKEGHGGFLLADGRLYNHGRFYTPMPARCNKCHNTAGSTTPDVAGSIRGSWKLDGIQCEQCHGPGPTMAPSPEMHPDWVPLGFSWTDGRTAGSLCRNCHSSGDATRRIPFDPAQELFSNHHPQGDEYRRSPHKKNGCTSCHNPHRSVWHEKGGVRHAEEVNEESIENMCASCHYTTRLRGAHGEIGITCVTCHMPKISDAGERRAHLFRIRPEPLLINGQMQIPTADNMWKVQGTGKYWMNDDGTTEAVTVLGVLPDGTPIEEDLNKSSFVTVDLVCTQCHTSGSAAAKFPSIESMAKAAKYIHRQPGLVDVTVNGGDNMQFVTKTQSISVDFALYPEENGKTGVMADTWVLSQGPKGWSYWNGTKWKSGMKAWRKGVALSEMSQNVLKGKLATGSYTYWVQVFPTDGSEFVDSVPVYVSKK